MQISCFNNLPKKGKPHTSNENITIDQFCNFIKFGQWKTPSLTIDLKEAVQQIQNGDKNKTALPGVTIGGTFKERKSESLLKPSGFMCLDFKNTITDLSQDKYVYSSFKTPSGNGLAVICRIDASKYKQSLAWLQQYFFSTYGIVCDPLSSFISSLRFASFDPELIINEKSKLAKHTPDKYKPAPSLPLILSKDETTKLIKQLSDAGNDIIHNNYDKFTHISHALANYFQESGRELFSLLNPNTISQNNIQYDIALRDNNKSKITIGTLFYYLNQSDIDLPIQNTQAIQQIALLKKSSPEVSIQTIKFISDNCKIPLTEAEELVREVYSRHDITISTVAADPEHLIDTLVNWLNQHHSLKKNSITGIIEETIRGSVNVCKRERFNTIYLHARGFLNSPSVTYELIERIIFSETIPVYNPFEEYIAKNTHRKTTGNIDNLIKSLNTDSPDHAVYVIKWICSWFAAIEGLPVRYVLSLVGTGRTGKTEWFRRLLPKDLQRYYGESKLDRDKDDELLMCQKLIIMDDELGGKNKHDYKRFKELTSKDWFSLRAAYGRHNEDFKRLAVLCGTSNEFNIINDSTGNTRYLPIQCDNKFNYTLFNSIDKDDLFMEAYHLYQSGFDWKLSDEEHDRLLNHSNTFKDIEQEYELIMKYFSKPEEDDNDYEYMTGTDIKNYLETHSVQKLNHTKLGIELRKIFGEPKTKREGNETSKKYKVSKKLTDTHQYQNTSNHHEPNPF